MRVFSKLTLRFDDPNHEQESVTVKALEVGATLPDWVSNSSMFKLAVSDGTLEVIETNKQGNVAEKKAADETNVKPASKKAQAAEGTDTAGATK